MLPLPLTEISECPVPSRPVMSCHLSSILLQLTHFLLFCKSTRRQWAIAQFNATDSRKSLLATTTSTSTAGANLKRLVPSNERSLYGHKLSLGTIFIYDSEKYPAHTLAVASKLSFTQILQSHSDLSSNHTITGHTWALIGILIQKYDANLSISHRFHCNSRIVFDHQQQKK